MKELIRLHIFAFETIIETMPAELHWLSSLITGPTAQGFVWGQHAV